MDICTVIGADCWFECVFGTNLLNQTELHGDESHSLWLGWSWALCADCTTIPNE